MNGPPNGDEPLLPSPVPPEFPLERPTEGSAPQLPPLPSDAPPRRRRGRILAVVAGVVVILSLAGGAAALFLLRGSDMQLLSRVPEGMDAAVAVYLNPSAAQKVNLLRIAHRFPDLANDTDLRAKVDEALDEMFDGSGFTHEDAAWVGTDVVAALEIRGTEDPGVVLLIDSQDDTAAADTIGRFFDAQDGETNTVEMSGVRITVGTNGAAALFDHTVVFASDEQLVRGVIRTSNGDSPSLAGSATFLRTTADLPADRLMLVYVNMQQVLDALPEAGTAFTGTGTTDVTALEGFGMTVTAGVDGLALDMTMVNDPSAVTPQMREALDTPDRPNELLPLVPQDAFAVQAVSHLDVSVGQLLDQLRTQEPGALDETDAMGLTGQDGLLSHLTGDLVLEVAPSKTTPIGGTLMVSVDDPEAVAKALSRLLEQLPLGGPPDPMISTLGATSFQGSSPMWSIERYRGVSIRVLASGVPVPASWAVVDHALVLALFPQDVKRAIDLSIDGGGIDGSSRFTDSLAEVPSSDGFAFIDVRAALEAIRSQLSGSELADFQDTVGRNMEPIDVIVVGSEGDADGSHARVFVRVP